MNIVVQNDANYPADVERLRQAAVTTLNAHESSEAALTIVLTDDTHVAQLNQQFRGVDSPTDILSFPADAPPIVEPDEPIYIGDLVIAYPYASAQAHKLGHIEGDSLALLVVHGTLHLLGFDHDTPENRADMWAAQASVLAQLNISEAIVPSLETLISPESSDDEPF